MHTWYLISVWLHLVAAAAWVGSMAFFGVVLVPVVRERAFEPVRAALMYRMGLRLRWVGWAVLGLLVVTGIANLGFRGYTWADLGRGTLWQGGWGHLFAAKMLLVAVVLAVSAVHDFYLGPRATRLLREQPGSEEALRFRRLASVLGRVTLLLTLAILALAVMLVRGW